MDGIYSFVVQFSNALCVQNSNTRLFHYASSHAFCFYLILYCNYHTDISDDYLLINLDYDPLFINRDDKIKQTTVNTWELPLKFIAT